MIQKQVEVALVCMFEVGESQMKHLSRRGGLYTSLEYWGNHWPSNHSSMLYFDRIHTLSLPISTDNTIMWEFVDLSDSKSRIITVYDANTNSSSQPSSDIYKQLPVISCGLFSDFSRN